MEALFLKRVFPFIMWRDNAIQYRQTDSEQWFSGTGALQWLTDDKIKIYKLSCLQSTIVTSIRVRPPGSPPLRITATAGTRFRFVNTTTEYLYVLD